MEDARIPGKLGSPVDLHALTEVSQSGTMLSCGIHPCPQHCHQLHDHSKMLCKHVMESRCERGHLQKRKCHTNQPKACRTCELDEKRRQKKLQAELDRQAKVAREEAQHAAEMAELDRQIQLARDDLVDHQGAEERAKALEQKKRDLATAQDMAKRAQDMSVRAKQEPAASASGPRSAGASQSTREQGSALPSHQDEMPDTKSAAEQEWNRQKLAEGATNDAIDALMGLTGLNDAKARVLSIKAKIETVVRQGTDMKNERLGIVLLGNPGTGMCLAGIFSSSLTVR